MSQQLSATIAVIGIDIGKNSFHVVGLDEEAVKNSNCTAILRLARHPQDVPSQPQQLAPS